MNPAPVVLAFSGGLDTSYCLVAFREQGRPVITVTVDTGGFSPDELRDIEARASQLGAVEHITIDGRQRLWSEFVGPMLKANYLRNGAYPSCVGVERMLQAEEIVALTLDRGASAIVHGSTGAGNDHVRFDAVIRALAPDLEIIAPVRDESLTREDETEFLQRHGVTVDARTTTYSFNYGVLGTSVGGGATYGSWEELPADAWPETRAISDAPDEPLDLVISFERGLPVAAAGLDLDAGGIGVPGFDILAQLNRVGAEHGIGRGFHMGQTIMGMMGRLAFEAPGFFVLLAAHRELERLVLSNRQQQLKASVGTMFGDLLHEGHFYDPVLDDIRALLDQSQERVTGDVRVRLHKGSVVPTGCRSPHSLLDASVKLGTKYGYQSTLWTGEDARSFAKIFATAGALVRTAAEPS